MPEEDNSEKSVYDEESRDELVEGDGISPGEEGFMQGYEESKEEEQEEEESEEEKQEEE